MLTTLKVYQLNLKEFFAMAKYKMKTIDATLVLTYKIQEQFNTGIPITNFKCLTV